MIVNNFSTSYHQVFIFAEGTTTNGQALIRFQSGGFQVTYPNQQPLEICQEYYDLIQAGRPVQPVTVQYSHPHLTTWTRDQVRAVTLKLSSGPLRQTWHHSVFQAHGMRWSMLLLLATPFKTVLTYKPADYWFQLHSFCIHGKLVQFILSSAHVNKENSGHCEVHARAHSHSWREDRSNIVCKGGGS